MTHMLLLTGCHISEVVQESEALRQQVELLQLQREGLTAQAEHAEEELSRCVCTHSLTLCRAAG